MDVPSNTSVISSNPNSPQGVISFAPELISLIQSGQKTLTYRLGDKYSYLSSGDLIEIREYGTEGLVAKAEITSIQKTAFGDIPFNREGHEKYRDKSHQREVFNGYYKYTGKQIADEDMFLVIGFKLISGNS